MQDIFTPENLENAGKLAQAAAKSSLGKKLIDLVGDRFKRKTDRVEKQQDGVDKSVEIQVLAEGEAQAELIRFRAELEKSTILAEYLKRADVRLLSERIRKDYNLDATINMASQQLESDDSDEKTDSNDESESSTVGKDWFTRWTSIVEDISEEDTQRMWANILTGEVKKPGSYSLRTLETLRDLSQSEADIFNKVFKMSIDNIWGGSYLPGLAEDYNFNGKWGIKYDNFTLLDELGLMQVNNIKTPLRTNSFPATNDSNNEFQFINATVFHHGGYTFLLLAVTKTFIDTFRVDCLRFSKTAIELGRLVEPEISISVVSYIKDAFSKILETDSVSIHKSKAKTIYSVEDPGSALRNLSGFEEFVV